MRVDFQHVVSQMANVDRFQNVSTVQVAESIRHSQNVAEQRETQRRTETIVNSSESGKVEEVKDEDRKRKALLSRGRRQEDKEGESQEDSSGGKENQSSEDQSENTIPFKFGKLDIRA